MSLRTTVTMVATGAMLAWICLFSAFAHVRYLHRPNVPDDGYRETTSTIQSFGNMIGIGVILTFANRALRKGDRRA